MCPSKDLMASFSEPRDESSNLVKRRISWQTTQVKHFQQIVWNTQLNSDTKQSKEGEEYST
jgi:hypothetical protein